MSVIQGAHFHITGIVQGVGFRPFVYSLATRLALTGWVRNTSAGVEIEVDGTPEALQSFTKGLREEAPPLARIDDLHVKEREPDGFSRFEIIHSESISDAFQPISPDVSICPDCLRELFDPENRRYRYPFINCTNCGPRFTIIQDIPYDRPKTTMSGFRLCPDCAHEYSDPLDRRFHAQPVACPECGPQVWLELSSSGKENGGIFPGSFPKPAATGEDAILAAQDLLASGKILAIKGLGGFHLGCDATNVQAVVELRRRKLRIDKPFALMMPDLATIVQHCYVDPAERELLESRQRPIVILRRKADSVIAAEVAPGQDTLGVMLPYTPLHYLLMTAAERGSSDMQTHQPSTERFAHVLVMTSGNLSEEPIATDNGEARQRLAPLADAFLMHDRPIYVRCDDSVVRFLSTESGRKLQNAGSLSPARGSGQSPQPEDKLLLPMRRSRGYAPDPLLLPWEAPPLLATGPELKNTFCITHDRYAFLSHHIGDLENYETLVSFEEGILHFERLFRVRPEALAYDLHPNYLATRYAIERAGREGLPAVGVQHHHAHIAACMAEHGLAGEQQVIGVAFDGTGYGEDGEIWGGEFLLSDYRRYQRLAHLAYIPLPGGDAAVRKPARIALAYLWQAGLEWEPGFPSVDVFCAEERTAIRSQLEHRLNAPLTSSMGRLFDAVAALVGVRQKVNYEAQAAIELEALVDGREEEAYTFDIQPDPMGSKADSPSYSINPTPLIQSVIADTQASLPVSAIAARFHNGVAAMVQEICLKLRAQTGIDRVVLSGGVWQNTTLLKKTIELLESVRFGVLIHSQVPTNDGGVALGQAAVAAYKLNHIE